MSIKDVILDKKKRPLPKSERYYDEEPESNAGIKRFLNFPVFLGLGLGIVVVIVIAIFVMNYNNNAFVMFNKSSTEMFESGSFHYNIYAGINGTTHMKYEGDMEFDVSKQIMNSSYHAVYDDYEYDAVLYTNGVKSHRGNYYGGKWSVEDYSEKALDFFDFYRDYRKGDFDAAAMLRFTDNIDLFNAPQLKVACDDIMKELSKPRNMNGVMRQELKVENGNTTITFDPQLEKIFSVVSKEIGSAFASADDYSNFLDSLESNIQNIARAQMKVQYTIDKDGLMKEASIDYTVGDKTYFVRADFSDFAKAEVEIPEGFFAAANIEK